MFDAVIFDMDGVIVDSEPWHIRAERDTLAPYNLNISDAEFHTYMGKTSRFLLSDMIEKYSLPVSIDDLYPRHIALLESMYARRIDAIPGALDLIRTLADQGIPLALASSSDLVLIRAALKRHHLSETFEAVVSGQEMARTKPFPDIFLEAARRLNFTPETCVVIEDSSAGVRAAKAAGMTCIGFNSPNSGGQNLGDADLLVDALSELSFDRLRTLREAVDLANPL